MLQVTYNLVVTEYLPMYHSTNQYTLTCIWPRVSSSLGEQCTCLALPILHPQDV
jgi:hypothetical protein